MGGSKASSISCSNERKLPVCACKDVMRLWISNTLENPKRPFWRCVNWECKETCNLFVWDDELDAHGIHPLFPNVADSRNYQRNHDDIRMDFAEGFLKQFAKEFANDFGKEFVKGFGKEYRSNKIDKLKSKVVAERKNVNWLMIALLVSWIFFAVALKL